MEKIIMTVKKNGNDTFERHGVVPLFIPENDKKILDIGCGNGYLSQKLIKRSDIVIGLDINSQNKYGLKEKNVKLIIYYHKYFTYYSLKRLMECTDFKVEKVITPIPSISTRYNRMNILIRFLIKLQSMVLFTVSPIFCQEPIFIITPLSNKYYIPKKVSHQKVL